MFNVEVLALVKSMVQPVLKVHHGAGVNARNAAPIAPILVQSPALTGPYCPFGHLLGVLAEVPLDGYRLDVLAVHTHGPPQ